MARLIPILLCISLLCAGPVLTVEEYQSRSLPPPLDPQRVQDQQDMTWADYRPIPWVPTRGLPAVARSAKVGAGRQRGQTWADPSLQPARRLRVALLAIDFDDQPFVITLPKQSDPFGNPQIDPLPRAEVPRFYADSSTPRARSTMDRRSTASGWNSHAARSAYLRSMFTAPTGCRRSCSNTV